MCVCACVYDTVESGREAKGETGDTVKAVGWRKKRKRESESERKYDRQETAVLLSVLISSDRRHD